MEGRVSPVLLRPTGRPGPTCRTGDGNVFSFSGTYLEVEPPTRTVQTWLFNESPDADATETMALHEQDGVTTLRWTLEVETKKAVPS